MPAIPSKASFTDAGVTEGDFKTALHGLIDYLIGLLDAAGTPAAAQVKLGTLAGAGVLVRSSAYTLVAADRGRIVSCTGTWTLGLTTAATLGNGFAFLVANTGSGTITIDPAGAETINGAATYTVGAGATVLVMAVGAAAWVVAGVALSDAIDSDSSSTAASSKAVKDAVAAAIGGSASATYHGVGSYAFAVRTTDSGSVNPNATLAGSNLRMSGAWGNKNGNSGAGLATTINFSSGTSLPGTWRCMGYANTPSLEDSGNGTQPVRGATLWLRIS